MTSGLAFLRVGALRAAAVLAAAVLMAGSARAGEPPKLLVLDTAFVDMMVSGTGESFTTPEDTLLVKQVSDVLRQKMAGTGKYRMLAAPADAGDPPDLSCPDCVLDLARAEGADLLLTSAVSRVNDSIVFLKFELDEVAGAKPIKTGNVQVNGFAGKQLRAAAENAAEEIIRAKTGGAGAGPAK